MVLEWCPGTLVCLEITWRSIQILLWHLRLLSLTCTESRGCPCRSDSLSYRLNMTCVSRLVGKGWEVWLVVSFAFSPDARWLASDIYSIYCIMKHRKIALAHRSKMLFGVNCCLYGSFYGGYKDTLVSWTSLVAQLVKNQPAMWETWIQFLGWEDPLEKGKAIHSSILAWRIPWTVQSMGSQRVRHDWVTFT